MFLRNEYCPRAEKASQAVVEAAVSTAQERKKQAKQEWKQQGGHAHSCFDMLYAV